MGDPNKELQHVNDIEREIQSLTLEDREAIDLAAVNFAEHVAIDPLWLMEEALQRIMDGRRKWPPNNPTPFRNFFCGVMKSIRREVCDKIKKATDSYCSQIADKHISPDQQFEHQEREKWAKQVIEETLEHFSEDDDVLAIIMGKSEGSSGEVIRDQEKMTRKQYDAALKRLSRYRNTKYPEGIRNE